MYIHEQCVSSRYNVYHGISKNQTDTGERCHVNWRKVSCELEKGVMWTGERCHVNWDFDWDFDWDIGFKWTLYTSTYHYIPGIY